MSTARSALIAVAAIAALLAAASGGWYVAQRWPTPPAPRATAPAARAHAPADKRVLYWYDPMVPQQHFDKPGKSPFMDMQLVAKYAEDDETPSAGIRIDPALTQNLGVRLAKVEKRAFSRALDVPATVGYDERDVAVVQVRSAGYVERAWPLAPGDVVRKGAPLAEILVPEWASAQYEYLALAAAGEDDLAQAALVRMTLAGMPEDLVRRVERERKVRPRFTIVAPIEGVVQELGVRAGMTLAAGATIARIGGLARTWVEAAVPESQGHGIAVGVAVEVQPSDGGKPIAARIAHILPETQREARTLRVRIELPGDRDRLRAGQPVNVRIAATSGESLAVPTQAVIRDGGRAIVLVSEDGGHFRPVAVETGAESDGYTAIDRGPEAGQAIVASGQFLIDSEANLKGVLDRMRADDGKLK